MKPYTDATYPRQAEEIFSSSFAAAAYLEQTKFKETGKKVRLACRPLAARQVQSTSRRSVRSHSFRGLA